MLTAYWPAFLSSAASIILNWTSRGLPRISNLTNFELDCKSETSNHITCEITVLFGGALIFKQLRSVRGKNISSPPKCPSTRTSHVCKTRPPRRHAPLHGINAPQSRRPRQSSIAEPGPSLLHAPSLHSAITDGARGQGFRPARRPPPPTSARLSDSANRVVRLLAAGRPPTPDTLRSARLLLLPDVSPPRRWLVCCHPDCAHRHADSVSCHWVPPPRRNPLCPIRGTCYPLFGLLD